MSNCQTPGNRLFYSHGRAPGPTLSTDETEPSGQGSELGQIRPSIWLDGEVIGRWELEPAGRAGRSTRVKIIRVIRPSRFSKKVLSGIEDRRRELELFIDKKIAPLRTMEEKP